MAVARWLVLACCTLGLVTAAQDTVLRFLSREQMAQKNKNNDVTAHEETGQPMQKVDQGLVSGSVKSVVCPGGGSECPDGNTCCELASGDWGCCPRPNAVCCKDHIHCCPQNSKCDLVNGTCTQSDTFVPWSVKIAAKPRVTVSDTVVCPGGQTQCPSGTTCCATFGGQYGCCPFPQAVCCSDGVHCCPNGFTCDLKTQSCKMKTASLEWLKKVSVEPSEPVVCPDKKECLSGQTCCQMTTGQYACCPQPEAVCCPDHLHCCPNGYTCDDTLGRCEKGLHSLPWEEKQLAKNSESIVCPDKTSECSSGQTCCQLSTGQYACCPQPDAVCCQDHVHCCPHGYKCDDAEGKCNKGLFSLPWEEKQPAKNRFP